jgi:hypothetical protein
LSPFHGAEYRQKIMNLIDGQRTSLQQDRNTSLVDPGTNLARQLPQHTTEVDVRQPAAEY